MKKILFLSFAILLVAVFSFKDDHKKQMDKQTGLPASNPFSSASTLPFSAPDFSKIKDADYRPALEEGIKEQNAEVEAIAENKDAPTFQNTLAALEKSGELLNRVNGVFNLVTGANTDDSLQQLQEDIAPKLSAVNDAVYLNSKLFLRIEKVYNDRDKLNLDPESKRLVEYYYQQFVLAGAKLSDADKEAMKRLNEEQATLVAKFTTQLVNAAKAAAFIVSDSVQLAGLSQSDLGAYAQDAKAKGLDGKWLLPIQNTTQQPALHTISVRDTREKLFNASWTRTEKNDSNDTRVIILRLAAIRAQQAKLMGFANFATWKLQDQMAKTPEAVSDFFAQLVPSVTAKAKDEATQIQQQIDKENGGFQLQPYDWNFYAEKVRKEKYNLDENEVKPYFELNKVLEDGVFYAANQLYGLTFKERKDIPVYQTDVRVFEVFDVDGKSLALFYCDYFKRDNKSGGAWMDNIIRQSKLLNAKPVIYNVCNFTKPAPGQPALISFDDVTTMFHEFGHGLHGMFANQEYPSISGANTARDFVEFPSQFNENWASYPTILHHYAVNYKTGEPIPQSLVDKIKNASSFNEGYILTEAIAAASLDMQWHKLAADTSVTDVNAFEINALRVTGLDLPQVPPRYRSSYFLHIWGNGYAAGYYAYQWTKMLAQDAYSWFSENGGLTRANGDRFRKMILSKGNTEDYNKMFKDFRGHAPDIKPMEKDLGLPVK